MPCSDSHQGNSRLACNAITVHARAARVAVQVQESFHISICQARYPLTMRRGGVEGCDAEAQKHSLGLIAVTCLSDGNCKTAQQGLSRLKETCLQSVTWMDKQCRVLTSANKKQSCRSCLHTPAPMIDPQASTRRWRVAMHSLDRCYHALYACGEKVPF